MKRLMKKQAWFWSKNRKDYRNQTNLQGTQKQQPPSLWGGNMETIPQAEYVGGALASNDNIYLWTYYDFLIWDVMERLGLKPSETCQFIVQSNQGVVTVLTKRNDIQQDINYLSSKFVGYSVIQQDSSQF